MTIGSQRTLNDLQFHKIKEIVARFASSRLGADAIDQFTPTNDREQLETEIAQVEEVIALFTNQKSFSLAGIHDLRPLLKQATEQTSLDLKDFVIIQEMLSATRRIREQVDNLEGFPLLRRTANRLSLPDRLENFILRTIDDRGSLRPDASPLLKELTDKRRTLEASIERRLQAFIDRSPELISESVITRRSGRLVIPIKSGAIGAMEFVVHDRSATGQTLYAEPASVVGANNAIVEIESSIRSERLRILRQLTAAFKAEEGLLLRNQIYLAHIDSLFARAGYAIAHRCSFPRIGSPFLTLIEGRHPLLPQDKVVPISLSVGKGQQMVVITGPNTGGKTVTLKTIGLLMLMVQTGIPIPASADSAFPVVDKIYTDIGDEQSIEQNLSTFSGHLKNIVEIIKEADSSSLLLLDELGAGTDPQEGAALGLAIMEDLLEKGSFVVISTHLTPLKYFAIKHPAIKPAAMEFDHTTLSPTFRVIEGTAGRSNAFIIAERLGLNTRLIERAKRSLSQGEIRAEDILAELEHNKQVINEYKNRAAHQLKEAETLKDKYITLLATFEERKEEEISQRIRKLDSFLRDSQRQVEEALANLSHSSPPAQPQLSQYYNEIANLRVKLQAETVAFDKERAGKRHSHPLQKITVGQLVHINSVSRDGRIIECSSGKKVGVLVDNIRFYTELDDLSPPQKLRKPGKKPALIHQPYIDHVDLELDVRGMTVRDAIRQTETFIERLLLADISSARILHGKGSGTLRHEIRQFLSACSFVKTFYSAQPQAGGEGVTEIELSKDDDQA
ncbi:endonuclease MutS2 [Candidatus Acetothermia bacterium]|nr:endonuclease MutS2 [Candidatus Acetothermia bacterium]